MKNRRLGILAGQILIGVVFVTAWQKLVDAGVLDKFFFSRPSDVGMRIVDWLRAGSIWPHLWVTLEEAALAFLLGAASGALVGFNIRLGFLWL